jgi:alpha-galactosidase
MPTLIQDFQQQGLDFHLELETTGGEMPTFQLLAQLDPVEPAASLLRLTIRANETPGDGLLKLSWFLPAVDMHGLVYFPPSPADMGSLPYWWGKKRTSAFSSLPFFTFYHRGGENRFAIGLLDQLTETGVNYEMSEQKAGYTFTLSKPVFFKDGELEEVVFLTRSPIPWQAVVKAYREFVDREWPQPRLPVPPAAFQPAFCTWTAIHHDVSQEWIVENARVAAELGFKTWITDDGWFTEKASFANYAYAGDWEPSLPKFPDFAGHVRQLQEMGFRYLLWVGPFQVGLKSRAAGQATGLLQKPIQRLEFANLSPRKKQIGERITHMLENLMTSFHLDGFKLDFIDSIDPEEIPPDPDYRTAGEGLYAILSQAIDHLRAINPEVLIEFRNSYTNLASRRYGNLYRASDVPVNFALNRWQVTLERLLTPDRAVLLDPALWHPGDSDENVAVTLINTITSVPMVSVDLLKYPASHLELIRRWIGFYNAHLDTIVHGEFIPEFQRGFLPVIRFHGKGERILGLYEDFPLHIGEGPLPVWVLNASSRPWIDLLPDDFSGAYHVLTLDKYGRAISDRVIRFPVSRLEVEPGGSLEIF